MDEFTLLPNPADVETGYSLTSTPLNPSVSPTVAQGRASMYDYALRNDSPGVDSLQQDIMNGHETSLRERLAVFESIKADENAQQAIFSFVKGRETEGKPLTQEDLTYISSLNREKRVEFSKNPELILEKKYAERITDEALSKWENHGPIEKFSNPEDFKGLKNSISVAIGVQRVVEDIKARYEQESSFTGVVSTAKTFVPFMSWYLQQNAVKDVPSSSFLNGNNIIEQVQGLFKLAQTDPDKAIVNFQTAVAKMYETSPKAAIQFAEAFMHYSSSSQLGDNIFAGIELATAPGAGALFRLTRGMASSMFQAAVTKGGTVKGVMNAAGNVSDAAYVDALSRMRAAADTTTGARSGLGQIFRDAVLVGDIDSITSRGTANFSNNFASTLADQLKNNAAAIMQRAGLERSNVTRMEPGSPFYNAMMRETSDLFNAQYPTASNSILSIGSIRSAEDALTNTDKLQVVIGRLGGQGMFDTSLEARYFQKIYGLEDAATIKVHDSGKFFLEVTKAMDETSPTVRQALSIASNNTPRSLANTMLGWLRSRDEILTADLVRETKNTTFGSRGVASLAADIYNQAAKGIKRPLQRIGDTDIGRYLAHERDFVDPLTRQRGRFSDTIHEFSRNFHQQIGRLPSEAETTFYFTHRQMNDADYLLRNLRVYTMKSRLGYEEHQFVNARGLTNVPWVEGRVKSLEEIYRFADEAGILVMEQGEAPRYLRKRWLSGAQRTELQNLEQQGYKVIQLNEFGSEALRSHPTVPRNVGNVNYVIVKDTKSRQLALEQIPYRPGGHVSYDENFYVGQANLHRGHFGGSNYTDYRGDTTLFAARSQREAEEFAGHLTTIVRLMRGNNMAAAQSHLTSYVPHITWQEWMGRVNSGVIKVSEDIHWRPRNKTIDQQHNLGSNQELYPNFTNHRFNAHNGLQEDVNLKFALERDEGLSTVYNNGTPQQPIWNFRASEYIDPFTTQKRANKEIFEGRYLDDYKIKASERFVAEFGHMLEGDALEWTKNPLRAVLEGKIKTDIAAKEEIAAAKNYQRTVKEFLHTQSDDTANELWLHDMVMRRFENPNKGEQWANRVGAVMDWIPSNSKQIQSALRSLSFSSHMGFFNPRQLFMQAQGVLNVAAIDGSLSRAMSAHGARFLMSPILRNPHPDAISAMADRAVTMGWDRKHFIESYEALRASGYHVVEGTFSGSEVQRLRTTQFFEMGERHVRLVSWNTAYLSWREANPLAVFDAAARKQVLNRADTLTINMSKASDAGFQSGWASIPTQFWSYQARLTDLMWGSRLTPAEKARLMATNALVYGVPVGLLGTVAPALPGTDIARKMLGLDSNTESSTVEKAFYNGLPQAIMAWATGGKVEPAIANSFGPTSLPFLYDIFNQVTGKPDKSVFEILGGASGKLVKNIGENMEKALPLVYQSIVTGDKNVIGIGGDALFNFLQDVSSANNIIQGFYMVSAGEYLAKNKAVIKDDLHPINGIIKAFFGANPHVVEHYFNGVQTMRSMEEAQKYGTEQATMYLRKSFDLNASTEEQVTYLKKAHLHMEMARLTPDQRIAIMKEVGRQGSYDKVQRLEQQFLRKDLETQRKWFQKMQEVK